MATKPVKKNQGYDPDAVAVSGGRENRKQAGDLVDIYQFPDKKWTRLRLFGQVYAYGGHWVTTKKKDGSKSMFYTACLSFDPETGKRDSTKKCPWCDHDGEEVRGSTYYYMNAIIRPLQAKAPADMPDPEADESSSGFKSKSSESWTPVRAIKMPASLMRAVKELKELNVHEDENGVAQAYGVSHQKFGCDIMVKHDKSAPPASQYAVQKGDSSLMKKSERALLTYDLSDLQDTPDEDSAGKDYNSWAKRMGFNTETDDEDEKPSKKKRVVDDDDEDDDLPKAKTKSKKPVVDDDDEEDELPVRKKPAASKKPVIDDDDDNEDDTPPVKKKVVAKKTPSPFDDEDEEEEPAPKAKKTVKKPVLDDDDAEDEPTPPKKSKKPVIVDDDEDEEPPVRKPVAKKARPAVVDDEDEDEDEPAPPKKSVKKKPSVLDDEDDD